MHRRSYRLKAVRQFPRQVGCFQTATLVFRPDLENGFSVAVLPPVWLCHPLVPLLEQLPCMGGGS